MKKLFLLSFILFGLECYPVQAQQDNFLKDFLERWETSRQYTLALAEAMPESIYEFKPTPEEMTFAQQLMHIALVIDWHGFSKTNGQEYPPRREDFKVQGKTKNEIIQILNREFERTTKLVKEFNPARLEETGTYNKFTRTRRQFLMLMADHVTHHRAQMVVYLRLKGIVPPKYAEYQ